MISDSVKGKNVKLVFVFVWTIAAFILINSPFFNFICWRLAFRKINIPIIWWLWVAIGAFVMHGRLCKLDLRTSLRKIISVALLFHLVVLTPSLIANDSIYELMDRRYLAYVFFVVYGLTLMSALWAANSAFNGSSGEFLIRSPLLFAPILCLAYSLIKGQAAGIAVFGSISAITSAFLLSGGLRNGINKLGSASLQAASYISKNRRLLLWAIFLLALAARLAFSFALISKTGPDYVIASDDGDTYDRIACEIAGSPKKALVGILVNQPWPPVYLVFLGTLYKIFGRSFYIVGIAQSILGAIIPLIAFLIGERLFNKNTGIIAGLLLALSQPLIFVSSILGTEAVYIPLIVLAIFLILDALFFNMKRPYLKIAISGILLGLATMTLGSITLFPVCAALFIVLARSVKQSIFGRAKIATVFFMSFLAVYFSVKVIYALETGTVDSSYEIQGTSLWSQPTVYPYDIDPDNRKFIALGIDPFKSPVESLKIAVLNWKEVMSIGFEVFPVRIRNFFLWNNFGYFDPILLANPARLPTRFASSLEFYTIVFFLIGFARSLRSKNTGPISFILLFIGYYMFIHAIVFMCHTLRYGCPVKPFMIIFLSYGLYSGCRYFFENKKA